MTLSPAGATPFPCISTRNPCPGCCPTLFALATGATAKPARAQPATTAAIHLKLRMAASTSSLIIKSLLIPDEPRLLRCAEARINLPATSTLIKQGMNRTTRGAEREGVPLTV